MTEIEFTAVTNDALAPHLAAVTRRCVEVFAEWPYLCEGRPGCGERYPRHLAHSPGAAVVPALAAGEVVGAATCQPAAEATPVVREALAGSGLDPACIRHWAEPGEGGRKAPHGLSFRMRAL